MFCWLRFKQMASYLKNVILLLLFLLKVVCSPRLGESDIHPIRPNQVTKVPARLSWKSTGHGCETWLNDLAELVRACLRWLNDLAELLRACLRWLNDLAELLSACLRWLNG